MNLRDNETMRTYNIKGLSKQQLACHKFTLFTRIAFISWAWPLIQFDTWSKSGSNVGCLIVKLFWTISRGVYLWLQWFDTILYEYRWRDLEEYGQMDHLNPESTNITTATTQGCEYSCGLRPRQNGHYFTDDIFKCISNENTWISINMSMNFVPQ